MYGKPGMGVAPLNGKYTWESVSRQSLHSSLNDTAQGVLERAFWNVEI